MKASIVFATGLILAAGAVVGSINAAHAGAAGSAGSISAEFSAGNVLTGTAGAVSVGKTGAFTSGTATAGTIVTPATSVTSPGPNGSTITVNTPAVTTGAEFTAVAAGYGGILTVSGFNTASTTFTVAEDTLLGTTPGGLQANEFKNVIENRSSLNLVPSTVGVTLR